MPQIGSNGLEMNGMKLDYLLDTNILILLINDELVEPIPESNLGYSIITEIEIFSFSGLSQDDEQLIRTSLDTLSKIPLTSTIAEKAIQLRRKYRLKTPDAIVLASAWGHEAVLLSNDKQLLKVAEVQVISLTIAST
jgi:predicted nucleic acid-binding protein